MSADKQYQNMGAVARATRVVELSAGNARRIIWLLAASVGLMMTGFGIIWPVFARRLGELGSGVEALGLMTMAFALAQFVASPFMGSLADRIGRRPLVLVGLAGFAAANIGFLFAPSVPALIGVRAFEGAVTAGLFPAAMGAVADLVPENRRARWVGIVMSSYGAGFIFGPVAGGFLFDSWGFAAPFIASASMGFLAFICAALLVPETRTRQVRQREALRGRRDAAAKPARKASIWASLPKPLYLFATLLSLDFIAVFSFAFVEPQMVFYFYDTLGWTTIQFGFVVGAYGLATVIGQAAFGRTSDRFGRKPIIIVGLIITVAFFAGMAVVTSFWLMMLIAALAGLGEAMILPALGAFYLDISSGEHRSRVMGIKASAAALGGVLGPLAVVGVSAFVTPQGVFVIAAAMVLVLAALALVGLRAPRRPAVAAESAAWEGPSARELVAQASLRSVVLKAAEARQAASSPR